jgi:hypothetical protein
LIKAGARRLAEVGGAPVRWGSHSALSARLVRARLRAALAEDKDGPHPRRVAGFWGVSVRQGASRGADRASS